MKLMFILYICALTIISFGVVMLFKDEKHGLSTSITCILLSSMMIVFRDGIVKVLNS